MSDQSKVLVIFVDEDAEKGWGNIKLDSSHGFQFKKTKFDDFTEGKRVDKYDIVLVYGPENSKDDIEMQDEIFKHYGIAPIVVVAVDNIDDNDFLQQFFGANATQFKDGQQTEAVLVGLKAAQERYNQVLQNDVIPAFNKFDKDGSGAIDKSELAGLMSSLGTEIGQQEIDLAMKDLDLNKDGVIDLQEFKRWYFTGMKSYNGVRRTFLKLGAKSSQLLESIKDEAKNALMKEELKYKKSSVSVGFNAPANPQTSVAATLNIGGSDNEKIANALFQRYQDAADTKSEQQEFSGYKKSRDSYGHVEIKFAVSPGSAESHAAAINEKLPEIFKLSIPSDFYFRPKVLALDDSTIAIGVKVHVPFGRAKLDEDIKGVLNSAGQHIHFNVELGTSLASIFSSEEPILMSALKGGYRVSQKVCLISNINRVIQELAKSENEKL